MSPSCDVLFPESCQSGGPMGTPSRIKATAGTEGFLLNSPRLQNNSLASISPGTDGLHTDNAYRGRPFWLHKTISPPAFTTAGQGHKLSGNQGENNQRSTQGGLDSIRRQSDICRKISNTHSIGVTAKVSLGLCREEKTVAGRRGLEESCQQTTTK